jgi:hypothetical protein
MTKCTVVLDLAYAGLRQLPEVRRVQVGRKSARTPFPVEVSLVTSRRRHTSLFLQTEAYPHSQYYDSEFESRIFGLIVDLG